MWRQVGMLRVEVSLGMFHVTVFRFEGMLAVNTNERMMVCARAAIVALVLGVCVFGTASTATDVIPSPRTLALYRLLLMIQLLLLLLFVYVAHHLLMEADVNEAITTAAGGGGDERCF